MKKILALIILGVVAYGGFQTYGVYSQAEIIQKKAADVIDEYFVLKNENEVLKEQRTVLQDEYARCTDYVSQDSGSFSEFEYCKRFLELTQTLELGN